MSIPFSAVIPPQMIEDARAAAPDVISQDKSKTVRYALLLLAGHSPEVALTKALETKPMGRPRKNLA